MQKIYARILSNIIVSFMAEKGPELVIHCLSMAFENLLGSSGTRVLQFHLGRKLGKNMYEVFYEDPRRFYEALEKFLGSGARPLMKLVVSWLIQNKLINNLDAEEFVGLLIEGGEKARHELINSFNSSKGV